MEKMNHHSFGPAGSTSKNATFAQVYDSFAIFDLLFRGGKPVFTVKRDMAITRLHFFSNRKAFGTLAPA